jgi:hypothetical protein
MKQKSDLGGWVTRWAVNENSVLSNTPPKPGNFLILATKGELLETLRDTARRPHVH